MQLVMFSKHLAPLSIERAADVIRELGFDGVDLTVRPAGHVLPEDVTAGLPRFWLVGHSFAGVVLTEFAGRHPERLQGLVYVDAVGNANDPPAEIREYFRSRDAGMTPDRLREAYLEMLGPLAKPETKRHILQAAARMDLPAFAALRASMLEVAPPRHFTGPKFAIEAEGAENPRMGSRLPGARRRVIPRVSHWLMLDDPAALNEALDEVLA